MYLYRNKKHPKGVFCEDGLFRKEQPRPSKFELCIFIPYNSGNKRKLILPYQIVEYLARNVGFNFIQVILIILFRKSGKCINLQGRNSLNV